MYADIDGDVTKPIYIQRLFWFVIDPNSKDMDCGVEKFSFVIMHAFVPKTIVLIDSDCGDNISILFFCSIFHV